MIRKWSTFNEASQETMITTDMLKYLYVIYGGMVTNNSLYTKMNNLDLFTLVDEDEETPYFEEIIEKCNESDELTQSVLETYEFYREVFKALPEFNEIDEICTNIKDIGFSVSFEITTDPLLLEIRAFKDLDNKNNTFEDIQKWLNEANRIIKKISIDATTYKTELVNFDFVKLNEVSFTIEILT